MPEGYKIISIKASVHTTLKVLAAEEGKSMMRLVEELVAAYVQRTKPPELTQKEAT